MSTNLFPYQKEAVDLFLSKKENLLVALPPGSGKSLIFYTISEKIQGKILIVAPKYVLYEHYSFYSNLGKVFLQELPEKGESSFSLLCNDKFLVKNQLELFKYSWDFMVFDESHMFKNLQAKRTKAALAVRSSAGKARVMCVTATPCPESKMELYPQIALLDLNSPLGKPGDFTKNWTTKINTGTHWETVLKNTDKYTKACSKYIFYRKVDTLPEQKTSIVYLEMEDKIRKIYESLERECWAQLTPDKELFAVNALWIRLAQVCSEHLLGETLSERKAKTIKDMLEDMDFPCIIWGIFREELKFLHEYIPESQLLYGGSKNGSQILSDFKREKFKVLIAHPDCIGAGVSLEVAGSQISSTYSPSSCKYQQSVARTNRVSQKRKVTRFELIYKDSVEEDIAKKISRKGKNEKNFLATLMKERLYGKYGNREV